MYQILSESPKILRKTFALFSVYTIHRRRIQIYYCACYCWPVICIYQNCNPSTSLSVTLWTLKNASACFICSVMIMKFSTVSQVFAPADAHWRDGNLQQTVQREAFCAGLKTTKIVFRYPPHFPSPRRRRRLRRLGSAPTASHSSPRHPSPAVFISPPMVRRLDKTLSKANGWQKNMTAALIKAIIATYRCWAT